MSTQVSSPRNARSRKIAESEILLDSGRVQLPGDAAAIAEEVSVFGCDVEDEDYEDWYDDRPYEDYFDFLDELDAREQDLRDIRGKDTLDWDQTDPE